MSETINKQIILSCEKMETRVAVLENSKLEEYVIERYTDEVKVGSIYLGKIVNLQPSLQAAFVDIGTEKNAFLHYNDLFDGLKNIFQKIFLGSKLGRLSLKLAFAGFALRNFFESFISRRIRKLESQLLLKACCPHKIAGNSGSCFVMVLPLGMMYITIFGTLKRADKLSYLFPHPFG